MSHKMTAQKYIFKLRSSRLRRAKWDLSLTLRDARRNGEVISIGDSQALRWIDQMNGLEDTEDCVREIRSEIRELKQAETTAKNRHRISALYEELDSYQFKPDYLEVVMEKVSDYRRAVKGFKVNGIGYTRLLGTAGGIKNSTIVFVSEQVAGELRERINCGRNQEVPMVPAKLEAYRALTCSASTPVSMPNGIAVVKDCKTMFREDIIMLDDEEGGEPRMRLLDNESVSLDESDGYGMMTPELAARWSEELGLRYVAGGMCIRQAWTKGMLFAFDYRKFADMTGRYEVTDVWGNTFDVRNVEVILTDSQLKLWNCYKSMEDYLANCVRYGYDFAVTKVCPEELEHQRTLNYQFIQSYQLDDEQLNALIGPAMEEMTDVLVGDWRKALLFTRGKYLNDRNVEMRNGFNALNAIMVNPMVYDDSYVKRCLRGLIERRIRDAKIGVIGVHGNYSIVCGDPYALCQSMFGLEVTGLLKKGEIFNRYWRDCGAEEVACFRAPMSCHANIRRLKVANRDDVNEWYQYVGTGTLLNAWDSTCAALNGMDKDADMVFLTDNPVLVRGVRPTRAIFCQQRTAKKKIVTEADLVESNIAGFGDAIGSTTNRVTGMYSVQAGFPPDSREYKTLDYRMMCGQL